MVCDVSMSTTMIAGSSAAGPTPRQRASGRDRGTQDSSITFSGAPTCVLGPGHSAVRGGCSVRHPQTATRGPRRQVPRGERQGCGGSTRVTSQTCTQAGGHGARAHACARENSLVRAALAAAGSHPVHGLRARTAGERRRRPRDPAGAGMRPRARVAAATAQTPMRPGRRRRPKLPAAPPQRKRSSRRVPPGGRRGRPPRAVVVGT